MNNSDERDYTEERANRAAMEREGQEELDAEQRGALGREWSTNTCPSYRAGAAHQPHLGCVGITLAEAYPALEDDIAPNAGSAS